MNEFRPGLEGVIAFETEIAEPDREGSALRYRGVDIEELVGRYPFEQVWGLLVDESFEPGHAAGRADRARRIRAARSWPTSRPGSRRSARSGASASSSTSAPSRRATTSPGSRPPRSRSSRRPRAATLAPVPEAECRAGENAAAQFLIRWRGEADPRHVTAVDTYWVSAAEHGLNASTFTARIAASTGADCAAALSAAVGALSGPLHGGAPDAGAARCSTRSRRAATPTATSASCSTAASGSWASATASTAPRTRAPASFAAPRASSARRRVEVAEELERAALAALREKSPDRVLETNVEFWAAVVLEIAEIPPPMYPAMFGCARVAGWSAHIVEQRRTGRLIRPSARYVGEPAHSL